MDNTIRNVATRVKAGLPQTNTKVTFAWNDVTLENVRETVEAALTVALQNNWRRNGIPAEYECNVLHHLTAPRTRTVATITPEGAAAALSKLPKDAVLAALRAAGFDV